MKTKCLFAIIPVAFILLGCKPQNGYESGDGTNNPRGTNTSPQLNAPPSAATPPSTNAASPRP
jgi:hypothetical protein